MSIQSVNGNPSTAEAAVMERYTNGAQAPESELCCPGSYDSELLQVIPKEILERDYGCGDPSQFVCRGDTVLDLGSGGGTICFMASQIAGPQGRVVGVDLNSEMLALARKHQPAVATRIGHDNVTFRRGRIQDLALDLDLFDKYLRTHRVQSADDMLDAQHHADRLRRAQPMIPAESIDIVLSNCVLNLVSSDEKSQLFREIFRVLKVSGRAAISDIVSDEPVPEKMQGDPKLWSGCISGAMEERAFLQGFVDAGFYGAELVKREDRPWRTVEGIEFRPVTVLAHKGTDGPCYEHNQAVIYRGPFRTVCDDDGHTFARGERVAVCEKTFGLLNRAPYNDHFYFVEPLTSVDRARAQPFDCSRTAPRHPRETKGMDYDATIESATCCGPEGTC